MSRKRKRTATIDNDGVKESAEGKKPFPLEKLPAELRKEIYGYIVVEDNPITLKTWGGDLVRFDHHRNRDHRGKIYVPSQRMWINARPSPLSLIYANKQTYLDATQVFYSENVFRFESTKALYAFVAAIGARIRHVRHVGLIDGGKSSNKGFLKSSAPKAFSALKAATGLRSLHIEHHVICGQDKGRKKAEYILHSDDLPTMVASACKPLLKSLKRSYGSLGLSGCVLDVLRFHPATCAICDQGRPTGHMVGAGRHHKHTVRLNASNHKVYNWDFVRREQCGCRCRHAQRKSDDFRQKVRAIVAGYLGIEA